MLIITEEQLPITTRHWIHKGFKQLKGQWWSFKVIGDYAVWYRTYVSINVQ